jgi:hypothetical protein
VTAGRDTGVVPWCAFCNRFLSPSTVRADGTCPECGRSVDAATAHASAAPTEETQRRRTSLPWHLWLLAIALAIYLGFRAWQGIEWVIQNL